jgi:hypothetical protein
MTYFMPGLGFLVLGFGLFQFSNLFNLYDADAGIPQGKPIFFILLRTVSYLSMAAGIAFLIFSFVKGG